MSWDGSDDLVDELLDAACNYRDGQREFYELDKDDTGGWRGRHRYESALEAQRAGLRQTIYGILDQWAASRGVSIIVPVSSPPNPSR